MSGKAGKKKPEKFRERIEFKFVFHATRVPHSGWEKLYVSLESIETGKTTAKTAKSVAQSGACRWPDAIIESTRLVHETRTNSYEAKLYKFVLGMSPTRVLGEITLNLADYVSVTSAASYAFPLKSCSTGTVLHIKLQCLTSADSPSTNSGEVEQPKEVTAELNDQLSEDEDDSSVSSSTNLPPPTPSRDKVLSRYNSDSSDVSTPVANGSGKNFYNSPEVPSPASTANTGSFNSRLERTGRLRASTESIKSLATPLKPAARTSLPSATVARLSGDNKAPGNVDEGVSKLEEELEKLKQQLLDQESRASAREEEFTVLTGERDGLREEVSSLKRQLDESIATREEKSSALDSLQEDMQRFRVEKQGLDEQQASLKLELEDCKHIIKELQQVLAYEKESKENLDTRLEKIQEEKEKLSSTVRELEETLADERKKMEDMSVKNIELQNSLVDQEQTMGEVERVLSQKVQDREEELNSLQQKLASLEAIQAASNLIDPNELAGLKKEVEELELDIKELTDENMDLIFKLNIANKELSRFSGESDYLGMTDMEERLEKFRREHQNTNDKLAQLESLCKEFKSAKADLEARLKSSLEEIQALKSDLKASRAMHAMDREAFSGRELRLKERADEMHEKYSMTFGLVADLQTELETVKKENSENRKRKDEVEAALNSLEVAKTDLAYRLADLESENLKSRSLARKYESDLGEKTQLLRSKAAKVSDMESKIVMLEASNSELESRIQELQSREILSTSRIVDLELQLSSTKRELEAVELKKQELETRVDGLELERFELGRMLHTGQDDNKFLKEKLDGILGELAESNALLEVELSARSTLEKRVAEFGSAKASLEKHLSHLEDENWQLTERIAGLEAQLNFVTEERETYRMQSFASENRVKELEKERSKLQESQEQTNKEYEFKVHGFEVELAQALEERDSQVHARKGLENQLEEMRELKEAREGEVREMEEKLATARKSYEECVVARKSAEGKVVEVEAELGRLNEELRKMAKSKAEAEEKSRRIDERAQLDRSVAVERLQAELQRLTDQMDATCDEKEHLASQALIEASELRAEKLEWEDARTELEERLEVAEAQADSLNREHEETVREVLSTSRKREMEVTSELEKSAARIAQLEASARTLAAEKAALESQIQKLERENSELRAKYIEISDQLEQHREAVAGLQSAKSELETSLHTLSQEKISLLDEKSSLDAKVSELSETVSEMEQLRQSKAAVDDRVSRLQAEQSASRALEVEQRCESIKLRRQNSEMKQKMTEQDAEREELRRRVECLEADVKKRRGGGDENGKIAPGSNGVLARSLSKCNVKVGTREGQELILLRDKIKSLEVELKLKAAESESLKREVAARQKEVNSNSIKKTDEQQQQQQKDEEANFPSSQELLQKELQRMQQVNAQLQEKLTRFKESSKWGSTLERVASLETELAEALESNTMYKEQLRSAFATQQNVHAAALQNLGDVDHVVSSLLGYKRKSSDLETELGEMRERYLSMSLRFAQVEAEREELVMTIRSLRNAAKK
ncbi:myosin-10 isoform X1 [Selaginella moellendorffii]|uniref:myosin-10 isoform X1 n=1 Tax=Selaginella moellendorffii TaxID=88036 RepID=UPI000D1C91C1|nr:myosin-10 isoform X1 [Selaginella moellendorffii]|eukprot:XP_024516302.1 myosin-10 isoform X1 [Selaginella moellendorffii]